jgi:Tfp pilus assembly protein PilF
MVGGGVVTRQARAVSPEPADPLVIRAREVDLLVADRPRHGRVVAEALAEEARAAGSAAAEVMACRSAAWAARELYEHDAARRLLTRAGRVARRAGLSARLGQVWVTRSAVHLELGDLRGAARDLAAARAAFAPVEPVELTFAEGLLAQKAGRATAAATAYRAVVASTGPDEAAVGFKAANNLGEVLAEAGRLDEADAALELAERTAAGTSRAFAAIAAVNRGVVAVQRGHLATAEGHFSRSRALARTAGLPLVEFRLEEVRALRVAGLWPEAEARLDALVRHLDAPGAALLRADAHLLLAEAALRNGDPGRARQAAATAQSLFSRQRRPADRAAATLVAVEAALALAGAPAVRPLAAPGEAEAAEHPGAGFVDACHPDAGRRAAGHLDAGDRRDLRRAAQMLDSRGELEWAVGAWLVLGRVEAGQGRAGAAAGAWRHAGDLARGGPVLVRARGHLARALAAPTAAACRRACASGLADIDAHREGVASSELRARMAGFGRALAEVALATLPEPCPPRTLFRWLEAGRSAGQVATAPQVAGAALADDLAVLRRLTRPREAGADRPSAEEERAHLLEVRRTENRVRRRAWSDVGRADARGPLDVGTVLDALGPATLVSYGTVGSRLVAVTVGRGRARRHDLGPAAPLAAVARSLGFAARRLSTPDATAEAAARTVASELRRADAALVAPLLWPRGRSAGPSGETVVVPGPAVTEVPWGALPSLAGAPVRVVPSARAWLDTAAGGVVACGAGVPAALLAGPGLPGAEGEVRSIARVRPGARVLLPAAATGPEAVVALDGVTIAHVACHGTMRVDAPLFSALDLADGPLTVYDVERVGRLPLVFVLAACDTGLAGPGAGGPSSAGGPVGDPLGFPSVLLQRGARAVVAATIPAPDAASSSLMVALHDELIAGRSAAEALAAARARVDPTAPEGLAASLAFACFGGG